MAIIRSSSRLPIYTYSPKAIMDLSHHFSIASAEAMQAICWAPLQALGLHYFNYVKIHPDGSREVLTTHAAWMEYFYRHQLYLSAAVQQVDECLPKGFYFWQELDHDDAVYKIARDVFDIDHGITFIERDNHTTTLYIFAAHTAQSDINHFYTRNIDLLKRFILYFNDKAAVLIKYAALNKIYWPKLTDVPSKKTDERDQQREVFISITDIDKYIIHNQGQRVQLTRREAESAVHMINGYTAKQTGKLLGLSYRTVEKFNQKVKEKLSYDTRAELESVLKDSGVYYVFATHILK